VAFDDGCDAVEGFGEVLGEVRLRGGISREDEGDGAVAAQERTEQGAGVDVGDAVGAVFEERAENAEDRGGDLLRGDDGEIATDVDPVMEAGGGRAEGAGPGLGRVVTAEDVTGCGATAAAFSGGENEATFHGESPVVRLRRSAFSVRRSG
jgi:hypothetical protein